MTLRAVGDLVKATSVEGCGGDRVEDTVVGMESNGRQGQENNHRRQPMQAKEQGLLVLTLHPGWAPPIQLPYCH